MYLSKLELVGFKSFPKKTALLFDEGVTAIVGPNGCGKSNIIDAIRWVIGEQRASVLRSDKMENVIFNGTGNRKPLGMAEVSLTIQNTKGILPTEYSEVTISRRLFRNGDSEYLLNKTQCRLKDIVELFMDTGMGANAYSVIELKMIETILSDRTGDRRQLFEEAAGVTRYKQRRKEALRKLEQTQADLERVHDIVREVAKKVNSLERQAGKAEEYKRLDAERLTLDIELVQREYVSTLKRIEPLENDLVAARSNRSMLDELLAREELTLRELEREQADIETALAEANRDLADISDRIAQVDRRRAVSAERKSGLAQSIQRAEREIEEAEGAKKALEQDRSEVTASREEIREQLRDVEVDYRNLESRVDSEAEKLAERKGRVREAQEEVVGILNRIGELRGEEERAATRIESLEEKLRRFDQEDAEVLEERDEAIGVVDTVGGEIDEAEAELERARNEFSGGDAQRRELRAEIDRRTEEIAQEREKRNTRRATVEFLEGLVSQNEAVGFLVESRSWTDTVPPTVADILSTDEEYARAISAALSEASSYLVVPSASDAVAGIRLLDQNEQGRATFICLDRLGETRPAPVPSGSYGRASDLARSRPEYDRLREVLLGETIVVETVEQALELCSRGIAPRAVTLDGQLVELDGIVRGGSTRSSEGAAIGRHEKISTLASEVEEIDRRIAVLRTEVERLTAEHDSIDLSALSDRVRQAQQRLGELEQRRSQAIYQRDRAEELLHAHAEERESTEEILEGLRTTRTNIEPRREDLNRERSALEERTQQLGRELEEFEHGFAELTSELNSRKIALVELQSEERSAGAELDRIDRDYRAAEGTITRARAEIENAREEIESTTAALQEYAEQLEQFNRELVETRGRHEEVSEQQRRKREEISQHADRIREERKGYEHSVELAHQLEVKIGELRSKGESLRERALEELELDLSQTELSEEDADRRPIGELREELRSLKGKIKMLGNVNLLAYEEWETESTRLTFLRGQVDDLQRAESDLVSTINEINETAQRQFLETFEAIRANFRNLFQTLFHEGDEADLVIEEGAEDILEARIEIVAKPRGKRPHSIDLLSGGEKTLTAISLLFAIYLVKPSPFCILDEVDAPLDDANIERFVRLIRRFDRDTQFIIVTHNKKTMAAADTVFGVTQQEDGISEILRHTYIRKGEEGSESGEERVKGNGSPVEEPASAS